MKLLIAVAALGLAVRALAAQPIAETSVTDEVNKSSHTLSIFFGESALVLGSADLRFGGGVSYSSGKPEPRLAFHSLKGQLVYEGYIDRTHSVGNSAPPNDSNAIGALAMARWFAPLGKAKPNLYFDLGWGLQLADRNTYDLPSVLNSTPVFDLGVIFPGGKHDFMVGVRFLHISNAGTVQRNRGQDHVFLTVGMNF